MYSNAMPSESFWFQRCATGEHIYKHGRVMPTSTQYRKVHKSYCTNKAENNPHFLFMFTRFDDRIYLKIVKLSTTIPACNFTITYTNTNHVPAVCFSNVLLLLRSRSSKTQWILILLHHRHFTPKSFSPEHLLQQSSLHPRPFAPEDCYPKQLLNQKTFTPETRAPH